MALIGGCPLVLGTSPLGGHQGDIIWLKGLKHRLRTLSEVMQEVEDWAFQNLDLLSWSTALVFMITFFGHKYRDTLDTYICWLVQLPCQMSCLSKSTRMPEGCFLGLGRCHRESLEPWTWTMLVRQQPTGQPTGWRCDLQTDRVKIECSPWCFPTGRLCCVPTEPLEYTLLLLGETLKFKF